MVVVVGGDVSVEVVVGTVVVVDVVVVVVTGHAAQLICPNTGICGSAKHAPCPPSCPLYAFNPSAAFVTGSKKQLLVQLVAHVYTSKLFGSVTLHVNFKKNVPFVKGTQ